ncbi:unnamed protein product [Chrysodeixis includens]|uniref:Uncharacterized protein n=1 Tax=Chrysodeixis includens TaxID=689277 RepID=A0A9N8L6F6_CHRIL|nr:unnamed protein product [Chrysodeixis includens]
MATTRPCVCVWCVCECRRRLLEELVRALVRQSYPRFVRFALAVDAVDLAVLVLQLGAHVERHVAQVTDHRVHLAHVLFHLVFTGVVCYPSYVAGLWSYAVALIHHPLRLVVDHLAVVVALPRTVVFLERCSLVAGQDTDAATLLHARQILLGLAHVRVDLVHALLDSVQLLCSHTSTNALDPPLSNHLQLCVQAPNSISKLLLLLAIIMKILFVLIFLFDFISIVNSQRSRQ